VGHIVTRAPAARKVGVYRPAAARFAQAEEVGLKIAGVAAGQQACSQKSAAPVRRGD